MEKKKKKKKKQVRKRYKLKPRFFCLIFSVLIIAVLIYKFLIPTSVNELPNFYGWTTEAVMSFESEQPNISIIYEMVYSETVRPTRVVSQSLQPGTEIGEHPLIIVVEISKGLPISD